MSLIPILNKNCDWNKIAKLGCFAVPSSPDMCDFLTIMHDFLFTEQLTDNMFDGKNSLFTDDKLQIVRSFVLNFDDKHPFSDEEHFKWKHTNNYVEGLLQNIWLTICRKFDIHMKWQSGNNSAGAHFYPKSNQSATEGLFPHIDSNLLVCNQPTGPGLEVWNGEKWIDAYIPDHIIINIGFIGWIASDYKVNPCIHRVKKVSYDRSVVVFSPGILGTCKSGDFCSHKWTSITEKFFYFFDKKKVETMDDVHEFRNMVLKSLM